MTKIQACYDLTTFKASDHFEQRALERFGVPATKIKQFLKDNSPAHETFLSTIPNRSQVLSRHGIMFVISPENKEVITVFKSIAPSVGDLKRQAFQEELNHMIGRYQLSTAQAYIQAISENINRFNTLSQTMLHSNPADLTFAHLDQIYKDVAVIKTTLNLLTKQTEYYKGYSDTYETPEFPEIVQPYYNELYHSEPETPEIWEPNPYANLVTEVDTVLLEQAKANEANLAKVPSKQTTSEEPNTEVPKEPNQPEPKALPSQPEATKPANTSNNNPEDYTPKVSNRTVLQEDKPLKELLDGQDRQKINEWVTKNQKSQLSKQIIKAIKQGLTRSQLLQSVKPQMKLIDYNNFKSFITKLIKEKIN